MDGKSRQPVFRERKVGLRANLERFSVRGLGQDRGKHLLFSSGGGHFLATRILEGLGHLICKEDRRLSKENKDCGLTAARRGDKERKNNERESRPGGE